MKKLILLFLFIPSISYAGTAYDNNVKRDCKNINKIEIMSQKEICAGIIANQINT